MEEVMKKAIKAVELGYHTAMGYELEFISRILPDGLGVEKMNVVDEDAIINTRKFKLYRLSITEDTWLAKSFQTFVVRLK
jgi:hypothetical protein